nr:MAG TPA_asm: hypothetical protein [Caudoviricetes sp.]
MKPVGNGVQPASEPGCGFKDSAFVIFSAIPEIKKARQISKDAWPSGC